MSISSTLSVIAPQFDSESSRSDYIMLASNKVNRCWYGRNADLATALWAAHMMTLCLNPNRQNGETGAISSKKEGDLSMNFVAGAGQGIEDLDQTHYGKQIRELTKAGGFMVGITGGNVRGC